MKNETKKESVLIRKAKEEINLLDWEDDKFYGGLLSKCVLELLQCFSGQNHSGASAWSVRNVFNRLADYKPLSPLTGKDDEWIDKSGLSGKKTYQNKRWYSLFKEDGKAYYIDENSRKKFVDFPFTVP